jgi:hypothetical protein
MRRWRTGFCLTLALLIGLPGVLFAQPERPMVKLSFDRQNDFTFSTLLNAWWKFEKGRYSLDLKFNHSNIYNTARDEGHLVQLYFHTDLWQYFRVKKELDATSWLETDQYVNNQNQKISVYGGVRYKPWPFLHIIPLLGYTWDTRTAFLGQSTPIVRVDQGFTPALYVKSEQTWPDQLKMRTLLVARYKGISPRRQHNLILDHDWVKNFDEGVTLDAGVHAGSHELDDYQGNSVKRILSDSIAPHLNLSYEFYPGLEWRSENSVMLHRRRFLFHNLASDIAEENDLTFQGVEIGSLQRLSMVRKKIRASASYEYLYSTRHYQLENDINLNPNDFETLVAKEQQKDFVKNFQKVEVLVQVPLSKRQMLDGALTNQYVQYDTPSETNFDDRDELSWVASGKWTTRWNKSFFTAVNLQGNYRHYAFLFKQKSQDNYIQRSLRADFDFGWDILKQIHLEGQQAIYVTYNIKDFSDYNKTDRATRNLESNFKLQWRPSARFQAESNFRFKETHQSYLNWEVFSETTLDTNRILTADNKYKINFLRAGKQSQWWLETGYKHFDQTKRFKSNMVGLDNLLKAISLRQISLQTGPLLNVGYRHRNQSTIDLGCWLQIQIHKNKYDVLATDQIFGAAQQEAALREVQVNLRPYFTARVNIILGGGN